MTRLAIITTHPIQYNAPVFRMLTERGNIIIKVFYTWGEAVMQDKYDPGFGKIISWDIPLTEGYDFCFPKNTAPQPGSHHFSGIDNPELIYDIKEWNADAILVFGWSFKSHLKLLRYFKGKLPVFFRGDSTLLDEVSSFKTLLRRSFLKWIYRHIDKALYVGENNKNYFLKHGLKKNQLIKAPHAIDNNRFSTALNLSEAAIAEERQRLGVAKDDFVLLFCGKFEEKKNPFFLIQLSEYLKDLPNFKILFVGNGLLENNLKEVAKDKTNIVFAPFQNQGTMPSVYKAASVFILPSVGPGETWGLAINEAMACGLPVLASTKCGGAKDLIEDYENGLTFAPNEIEKVAKYLRQLYADSSLYKRTGTASLKKIEQFSFEQICEAIEQITLNSNE